MPDMEIFDPLSFFSQRISEVEEQINAKRMRAEILTASQNSLGSTVARMNELDPDHRKALQVEMASLVEALANTERTLEGLEGEIELLSLKHAALRAALSLVQAATMDRSRRQ